MATVASAEIELRADGAGGVQRELGGVASAIQRLSEQGASAGGSLGSFGSAVLGGAVVAGAQLAMSAVSTLAGAVGSMAMQAFDATRAYESMSMSFQSLAAREAVAAGEAASVGEAFDGAAGRAQELLAWTQQLAITSPFEQQGVAQAFRTAMAYGFATDEAQRLTQATIDFAAATGAGTFEMDRITRALGQIRARGKVSFQELQQLAEAGVPALQILGDTFNMTGDQLELAFRRGEITAQQAIEAITTSLETDFEGAAARTTNTLGGLVSTLGDVKDIGLRNLFGGIFEGAQPALLAFAEAAQGLLPSLESMGTAIGQFIAPGLERMATLIEPIFKLADGIASLVSGDKQDGLFKIRDGISQLATVLGFDTSSMMAITDFVTKIAAGNFTPLTDLIPPELRDSLSNVADSFSQLGDALATTGPDAQAALEGIASVFNNTFNTNAPQTLNNISSAVEAMAAMWEERGPTVIAVISTIAQWLIGVLGGAFSLFSGIVSGVLQAFSGDFTGAFATILSSVETFANSFLALIGTNIEEVRATWANNFEMMGLIVSTLWLNMVTGITNTIATIKATLLNGLKGTRDAITETIEDWVGIGRTLIQSIVAGMSNAASNLYATIRSILQGAIDNALSALQIGSPSKPFLEMGVNVMHSFGLGAERQGARVETSMGGLMSDTVNSAGAALPAPSSAGAVTTSQQVTFYVYANSFDDIVREAAARGYAFTAVS